MIRLENPVETLGEIGPLYSAHYDEMRGRLAEMGVIYGCAEPDMKQYLAHAAAGSLLHFVARVDGEAVGYANVFIGPNRHNGESEAVEDAIYVSPAHRGRLGPALMKAVLAELKTRNVKRFNAGASTDPRAAKLWARMGFKPVSMLMSYEFGGAAHVRT